MNDMHVRHITTEELGRFAAGTLDAESVLFVGRHLSACSECAAKSAAAVDIPRAAKLLRRQLAEERGNEGRVGPEAILPHSAGHRRGSDRRWTAVAAAIVIAVLSSWFFLSRRQVVDGAGRSAKALNAGSDAADRTTGHPQWDLLVADALRTRQIARPSELFDVRASPDRARGTDAPPARPLLQPSGVIVGEPRPTFTWPETPGATYAVSIYDGGLCVARSGALRSARWVPETPLAGRRVYAWQVEVRRGAVASTIPATPDPPALFEVAGEAMVHDLETARRLFPEDHLLLGVLYAHAALQSDAVREFAAAAAAHSKDTAAAELERNVRAW